jgi:hypothetical protein
MFILTAGLLAAWWAGLFDLSPRYHGLPAAYWLECDNFDKSAAAFQAMGAPGALFLANALRPTYGESVAHKWDHSPLAVFLPDWLDQAMIPADEKREHAADLLRSLGTGAEPALPVLWQVLRQPGREASESAFFIMETFDSKLEPIVPELIQTLGDTNSRVRPQCIALLLAAGPKAKPAIPCLLKIGGEGGNLSLAAANALWQIGRETNAVVQILTQALQTCRPAGKLHALRALGAMPPLARLAAVPALRRAMFDSDWEVCAAAATLLREVDPGSWMEIARQCNRDPSLALPPLIQTARSATQEQRLLALKKIGLIGPQAKEAVLPLIAILRSPVPRLLSNRDHRELLAGAADTLGRIGPAAGAATGRLVDLLERSSWNSHAYCRALGEIGPAAAAAVPTLEGLLEERGRFIRLDAASALCRIAPQQASNYVAVLRALQNAEFPVVRCGASVALWRLGLETRLPLDELTAAAAAGDARAMETLGDIGPLARPVLPTLEAQFNGASELRYAAAATLGKIAPDEASRLDLPGILLLSGFKPANMKDSRF